MQINVTDEYRNALSIWYSYFFVKLCSKNRNQIKNFIIKNFKERYCLIKNIFRFSINVNEEQGLISN